MGENNSESSMHSMQKIFNIVEYMAEQKRKLSIQEISVELNMPTATVFRILRGLKDMGYVEQHYSKQYYLTYKMFQIGGKLINRDGFLDKMVPYLNYFALKYGCEMGMAAFNNDSIIHILNVGENIGFGGVIPYPGSVSPAYCTAAGKVFLSQMSDEELHKWIEDAVLVPYTRKTIIKRGELFNEIIKTRQQGYGVVAGEFIEVVACASFPVRDAGGNIIGAFNFRVKTEEAEEAFTEKFVSEVKETLRNFGL